MSVLNFPRIYFKGEMAWNPPTGNNNDVLPFYEAVNVDLNWAFLESQGIRESDPDVKAKLHDWMTTQLQAGDVPSYVTNVPGNSGNFPMIPAEWDLFGDNACSLVNYKPASPNIPETKSLIHGGQLQYENYIRDDNLIGKPFQVLGNPFGTPEPTPGRFVDISPWENTFTALYFDKLIFGDETVGLELQREFRMLDRFLNFNWGALGGLSAVTTTWQSCFPKESISWYHQEQSELLEALMSQMDREDVAGIMVRFSTYLTVYDRNGVFNDYLPFITHGPNADPAKIKAMYQKGLANASEIFFNPAHSIVSGTVGLWNKGEFPTAPGGRRLVADTPITVPGPGVSVPMGVTMAELNETEQGPIVSLDVSNTFPYSPNTSDSSGNPIPVPVPTKYNVGEYSLIADESNGSAEILRLHYSQYQQSQFDLRSGLMDIRVTEEQAELFKNNKLSMVNVQSPDIPNAQEQQWIAEIIESGTFVDVGQTTTLNIMLQHRGVPAPAGTKLWVAQYSNPYLLGNSGYYLCFEPDAAVDFPLTDSAGNAVYPQFKETTGLSKLSAESSANDQPQVYLSRITANSFVSLAPASLLQNEGAMADSAGESYRQIMATPVGAELVTQLDFVGGKIVNRTLESGVNISYRTVMVETNAQGIAQVSVTGVRPGFPTLAFNSIGEDQFAFSFQQTQAYVDFMAPVRVLPHDSDLMGNFVAKWNQIYQQADAGKIIWEEFIYPEILEVFYYLYPIMDKYMPLDSLTRVEHAVDQLIVLISAEYREESTLAMPITRDLPSSSRQVLELWANKLVKRNYPPEPL